MKSLSFLLVILVACGGAQDAGTTTPGGAAGGSAAPVAAGDVPPFEIPAVEIKGVPFEPEALGRPGMPLVEAKKKITIEKQRTVFTSTKDPVQKEAQAAILATLLYQQAKDQKPEEAKKAWTEARQALRDAATISNDKVDEITLRLLGSYELLLEDYPAAEKAWSALVAKAPKDKDAPYARAWWAFALLKQFKNADALAAVKDEPLAEKQPELAYVTAWARWRSGDDAGAWQAIVVAAKGWGQNAGRDAIERDVLLFAGRTNIAMKDALAPLTAIFGKAKNQQYEMLAKLGLQSYQFAGRWADGVAALDKAIEIAGETVPPNDRPVIRFQQGDFTVRLDEPETAAKYAKLAVEALPTCGAKCTEATKQDVVQSVFVMARLFHILYATANDVRYYQPAHDLYMLTIPLMMDAAKREGATKDAGNLELTLKNTKAGRGTHDKVAIGALLGRHNQEIQACYESTLAANPKLVGILTVNLEADGAGAIKGVSTEPKAGLADLSAVAGCVAERVKAWKLPKRGMATGVTRIKLSYQMSPRK